MNGLGYFYSIDMQISIHDANLFCTDEINVVLKWSLKLILYQNRQINSYACE